MSFTVIGTEDDRNIERHVGRDYARSLATRIAEGGETAIVRDEDGEVKDEKFEAHEQTEDLQADGIDRGPAEQEDEGPLAGLNARDAAKAVAELSTEQLDAVVDGGELRKGVLDAIAKRREQIDEEAAKAAEEAAAEAAAGTDANAANADATVNVTSSLDEASPEA